MNTYFARQPILDKTLNVYGYELLYRKGPNSNLFTGALNEDQASSTVVENLHSVGIENITGGKKAFVNFTYNFLTEGLATLFSPEYLVVEVLETIVPDELLIESINQIKDKGYLIALDDFVYSENLHSLVELADVIKVEFNTITPAQIKEIMMHINMKKVTLLAEKVETREEFDKASSYGFRLFQGYFFSKPIILEKPRLSPTKLNYIQLIRLTTTPNLDFAKITQVIRRDFSLTYRLLRLVNSAFFSHRSEINDILQAVTFLGEKELKKWVSLIAMIGIADDKPIELVRLSMVRARFCEQFAIVIKKNSETELFFLTGMFSIIDAIMDTPLPIILSDIAVPQKVSDALIDNRGVQFEVLELIIAHENAEWDTINEKAANLMINSEIINETYLAAVKWCDQLSV